MLPLQKRSRALDLFVHHTKTHVPGLHSQSAAVRSSRVGSRVSSTCARARSGRSRSRVTSATARAEWARSRVVRRFFPTRFTLPPADFDSALTQVPPSCSTSSCSTSRTASRPRTSCRSPAVFDSFAKRPFPHAAWSRTRSHRLSPLEAYCGLIERKVYMVKFSALSLLFAPDQSAESLSPLRFGRLNCLPRPKRLLVCRSVHGRVQTRSTCRLATPT